MTIWAGAHMARGVDWSQLVKRVMNGFESTTQMVVFCLVAGGALVFCGYLVWEGLYHRFKWRRLRKKYAEGVGEADVPEREDR